jgi:hypothetical protein
VFRFASAFRDAAASLAKASLACSSSAAIRRWGKDIEAISQLRREPVTFVAGFLQSHVVTPGQFDRFEFASAPMPELERRGPEGVDDDEQRSAVSEAIRLRLRQCRLDFQWCEGRRQPLAVGLGQVRSGQMAERAGFEPALGY